MSKSTWRAPKSSAQRKRTRNLIGAAALAVILVLILLWVFWPSGGSEDSADTSRDPEHALAVAEELITYPGVRVQGRFIDARQEERPFTSTTLDDGAVWGTFSAPGNDQPIDFVVTSDGRAFLKGTGFVWESLNMQSDWNGWALAPEGFITPDLYLDPSALYEAMSEPGAFQTFEDGWFLYANGLAAQLGKDATVIEKVRRGGTTMTVSKVDSADAATGRTGIDAVADGEYATIEQVNNRWVVRKPAAPEPERPAETRGR